MRVLFISDLHFSHRTLDQNRWDLFRQVKEIIKTQSIGTVIINGDISEFKSGHTAEFVNRVVREIRDLAELVQVIIVNGNHDGVGAATPFFGFLGLFPNITYYNQVTEAKLDGREWLFLPHTRTPLEDWKDLDLTNKIVCAHVSVDGVMSESGVKLTEEVPASFFDPARFAISGDIHNACEISKLVYIGSPYMTRFGKPHPTGGVILDTDLMGWVRVKFDFPLRVTFDVESEQELEMELKRLCNEHPGRHDVKIRLHLKTHNMADWRDLKQQCSKSVTSYEHNLAQFELINDFKKIEIKAATVKSQFTDFETFCDTNAVPDDLKAFGREILAQV